jgi:hypothetical protein
VATEDLAWALERSGAKTASISNRVRAASDHLAAVLGRPLRSRVREVLRPARRTRRLPTRASRPPPQPFPFRRGDRSPTGARAASPGSSGSPCTRRRVGRGVITRSPPIESVAPMLAKMSPTSPRGTIPSPRPTCRRPAAARRASRPASRSTATIVSTAASPRTFGSAKDSSWTRAPVSTKKIGTRKVEIGCRRDSMLFSRLSSNGEKYGPSRISPGRERADDGREIGPSREVGAGSRR